MSATPRYETFDVPIDGGSLVVGAWGEPGAAVVVAAHGITASHLCWARVAEALGGDVRLVAPDLRGRGGSAGLSGPFGMRAHAADLVRVLDFIGAEQAVLVGHSMGAFVVAVAAARWPARARGLVMVDGGIPLEVPPGVDVDSVLAAVIGPALDRLRMTFASPAAYRDFWRAHPAFAETGTWDEVVEAYVDYDLVSGDGGYRSRTSLEAVRADGADVLTSDEVRTGLAGVRCPAVLLWAERGMQNEPQGLYSAEVIRQVAAQNPGLVTKLVGGVNHYTILLGTAGASVVADALASLAGPPD